MGLLNSFCFCCYWCGSPMGRRHGGEPFEESLKGSCVRLPRHSSGAWRGFLHDPAFIFFSSWCLNYCIQGRIRSVFPKINGFDCLLKHRTTQGTHLDFAMWAAGWMLWQRVGPGSLLSHPGQGHSLGALFGREQSGGLCTLSGRAKGTIFKQTAEQEMNELC